MLLIQKKTKMHPYKCERGGINIKKVLMIVGFGALVCYGLFNARNLILGPQIEIYTPAPNAEIVGSAVLVQGRAQNITFLSLNDRPISIDPDGHFKETLLLPPGSNIIRLYGRDRFKQETVEEIEIYFRRENLQEVTE